MLSGAGTAAASRARPAAQRRGDRAPHFADAQGEASRHRHVGNAAAASSGRSAPYGAGATSVGSARISAAIAAWSRPRASFSFRPDASGAVASTPRSLIRPPPGRRGRASGRAEQIGHLPAARALRARRVPERVRVHRRDFRAALRDGEDLVPGAADDGMRGAVRRAARPRARVRRVARDARPPAPAALGSRPRSAAAARVAPATPLSPAARPASRPRTTEVVFEASVRERQADGAATARPRHATPSHARRPAFPRRTRACVDQVHEHRQDVHGLLPLGRVRGIRAYQISSGALSCVATCVASVASCSSSSPTMPARATSRAARSRGHAVGVRLGERRARVVRVLARGRQRRARAARLHGTDLVAALRAASTHVDSSSPPGRAPWLSRQPRRWASRRVGPGRGDGARRSNGGARGEFEATRVACVSRDCTRIRSTRCVDLVRPRWIGSDLRSKQSLPGSAHRHKNLARTLKAGVGEGNSDAKVCSNAAVMLPAVFHHRRALSECRETSLRSRQDALLPRLSVVLLVLGRLFAADADLVFLL